MKIVIFGQQINVKTMTPRARSIPRTQAREAEKKLMPAIKVLSQSVANTKIIPDNFKGYKATAGEVYVNGIKWQYQVHAVCAKKDFIKDDKVVPMFAGWNLIIKLKAFVKYVIDWSNK